MKKAILITILVSCLIAIGVLIANAQTSTIPTQIADAGVAQTKQQIDAANDDLTHLQTQIASAQTQEAVDQTTIATLQQAILALATQSTPLASAVAVCASNPALYCPGYGQPLLAASGASCSQNSDCQSNVCVPNAQGVNWNASSGTCQ